MPTVSRDRSGTIGLFRLFLKGKQQQNQRLNRHNNERLYNKLYLKPFESRIESRVFHKLAVFFERNGSIKTSYKMIYPVCVAVPLCQQEFCGSLRQLADRRFAFRPDRCRTKEQSFAAYCIGNGIAQRNVAQRVVYGNKSKVSVCIRFVEDHAYRSLGAFNI